MEKATLKALKKSIKHWKGIVAGKETSRGTDNCALCDLFYNENDDEHECCVGCPVMERTEQEACGGSPYGAFTEVAQCKGRYMDDGYGIFNDKDQIIHGAVIAAKDELSFLQSLLPEKST